MYPLLIIFSFIQLLKIKMSYLFSMLAVGINICLLLLLLAAFVRKTASNALFIYLFFNQTFPDCLKVKDQF